VLVLCALLVILFVVRETRARGRTAVVPKVPPAGAAPAVTADSLRGTRTEAAPPAAPEPPRDSTIRPPPPVERTANEEPPSGTPEP
jgi:hypothetical protein